MNFPSTCLLRHSSPKRMGGSNGLLIVSLVAMLLVAGPSVWGQSAEPETANMTVDELEAFIAKQQAQLDAAKLEREKHLEKRRQVQAALDEKKKKLASIESEMEILCEERNKLDPESNETCIAD